MPARRYLTREEYLATEQEAGCRSEYQDGVAYAMAGASPRHNLIVMNVGAELHGQLLGKPCAAYSSDTRVLMDKADLITYPDLVVICGEPVLVDGLPNTVANPTVLIEVLSPSTESYDRGAKSAMYRDGGTLQAYVLIAQDRRHIEVYSREPGGRWVLTEARAAGSRVVVPPIGCALSTDAVYDRVKFDNTPTTPGSDDAQATQET